MAEPLLNIKNLSFSISDKKILDNISLEVNSGDYLSIIGPNGSGKTTLIKCLLKIIRVQNKSIYFKSRPIEDYPQKELAAQVSYVPQINENSFPYSAKEFLMLSRYPHFSRFTSITKEDKAAVTEAFEITGTSQLADRQINTLSGGEKQMIFIAAALAQGGELLVLDEPATFLDPKHEHGIYAILKKIHSQTDKTIITVTHNINSAILHSDNIVIIKNGSVFYSGSSDKISEGNILAAAYEKNFSFMKHPVTDKMIILPEVIG
ncbi:MAG: ABC transporter ATP-binding protein [Melioribacteraceae bacterium]|nr:ABC transporter ATP-binding protein [Melioribacteraceae bacterium]